MRPAVARSTGVGDILKAWRLNPPSLTETGICESDRFGVGESVVAPSTAWGSMTYAEA